MKHFFKLVWHVVRYQIYERSRLAWLIILCFLPLFVVITLLDPYEDDLPQGMLEVIYLVLGFLTLILLMRWQYRSSRTKKDN